MCNLHRIHEHVQLTASWTDLQEIRRAVCLHCLSPGTAEAGPDFLHPGRAWWHHVPETPKTRAPLWGFPLQPAPETPVPIFFPVWKLRKKDWNISEGILPDIHVSTFSAHSRGAAVTNVLKVFKCWQIQFSFEGCQQFCGSKSHLQSKGESLALTFEKWRLLWIYEKGSLKCFLSNCCWGA